MHQNKRTALDTDVFLVRGAKYTVPETVFFINAHFEFNYLFTLLKMLYALMAAAKCTDQIVHKEIV